MAPKMTTAFVVKEIGMGIVIGCVGGMVWKVYTNRGLQRTKDYYAHLKEDTMMASKKEE